MISDPNIQTNLSTSRVHHKAQIKITKGFSPRIRKSVILTHVKNIKHTFYNLTRTELIVVWKPKTFYSGSSSFFVAHKITVSGEIPLGAF